MKEWLIGGTVVALVAVVLAVMAALPKGNDELPPRAAFSSGVERDIGTFLSQEATDDDLTDLFELLSVLRAGRQGRNVLPGKWSIDANYHNNLLCIELLPDAGDRGKLEIVDLPVIDARVERVELDVIVVLSTD